MLTAFCIVATLSLFFMCVIWSREGLLNLCFKMLFGALTAWGLACTLMQLGFHQ